MVDVTGWLPGVVECRCHTGNSGIGHRQSRPGRGIPGSCGEVFRKVSGAWLWWFRDGAGAPPQPPPCATRSRPRPPSYLSLLLRLSTDDDPSREEVSTLARWRSLLDHRRLARLLNHRHAPPGAGRDHAPYLSRRCAFRPMTTRSREEVSTPARWRSLLDHRRTASRASTTMRRTREQTSTPAYPSRCCAFQPDDDPQPRGGLDTRSLALAARPPEGWRARPHHEPRRTSPVVAPSTYDDAQPREVSTPARWRSLLDHRRAGTPPQPAPSATREAGRGPAPYLSPSLRL
jgi:hypothetical protein